MSKNTVLKFKKEELDALLNDPNSQVHLQEDVQHHMLLPPVCLRDPHAAILEILNSDLMKYLPKYKGILLCYKHVRMLGTTGKIYDDNCHIHINLLVDFYIFTPTVGCVLTGIVSKKSPYNIGLLVHKGFNVAIPILENETSDDWTNNSLQIGQEIKFEVEILNFHGKLPYIRGKLLNEDLLTSMTRKKKKKSKNKDLEQPMSENEESSVMPSKSHKRKRKHSEVSQDQTVVPALIKDISSDSGVSSPSSKRRKFKFIGDTEEINKSQISNFSHVYSVDTALQNIDAHPYKKKKKKHKSKNVEDCEEGSVPCNNVIDTSDLDKMQPISEQFEPSRISQMYEATQPPKKNKKKNKEHILNIEDQMQQGHSSESGVQNCTASFNNDISFANDHDDSLTVNYMLKEKKRKKHRSETEDVSLHVKSHKKQKYTEKETG